MEANEHVETESVPSWQRWSVWLAKAWYSDLELSTVVAVQRLHAGRRVVPVMYEAPAPVAIPVLLNAAAD